jgi:hypothetical protein
MELTSSRRHEGAVGCTPTTCTLRLLLHVHLKVATAALGLSAETVFGQAVTRLLLLEQRFGAD